MSTTKTININVINPDAENTFAALGMDGSDEALKAFAEKLSGITSKILDGMTGKNPDFNRNNALKEVQDNLSYEECVLLATAHLEDRAESEFEKLAFMEAMKAAQVIPDAEEVPAESEEKSK